MNKELLFQFLSTQDTPKLLDLLSMAYDHMEIDQRRDLFGDLVQNLPPQPVDGEGLLAEIEEFCSASLAEYYYAPFQHQFQKLQSHPRRD